jgi:hypothetical protein
MYKRLLMVRYCTDLIIFGTCEEKMFFNRALQIFKTYPRNVQQHKTVIDLKEHTRKDLELKFRNVHALIKKK